MDAETLHLTLHWQVLQTLLPPHHLFVHLDDNHGRTLSQDDGPPAAVSGRVPTGSWLPGEFASTLHTVPTPDDIPAVDEPMHLSIGIYNPDGNIRLPATVDGEPAGDTAKIPLPC